MRVSMWLHLPRRAAVRIPVRLHFHLPGWGTMGIPVRLHLSRWATVGIAVAIAILRPKRQTECKQRRECDS